MKDDMLVLSTVQIVVSGCVVIGLSILICAILYSKTTREQPFNVYLINFQLVDLLMNIKLIITHAWYHSHRDGNTDTTDTTTTTEDEDDKNAKFWIRCSGIVIFTLIVNMYLSAIIAYYIYRLLESSYKAIRVKPPTIKRVLIESGIIYFVGISLAVIYVRTRIATQNSDYDESKDERIWGWCMFCLVMLPFLYVVYVVFRVWKRKLLPLSNNRTRTIAIYFCNIVVVFMVFYIPGTIFFALGMSVQKDQPWTRIVGTILYSLQGIFSLFVALTKPDIYEATIEFLHILLCCCHHNSKAEHNKDGGEAAAANNVGGGEENNRIAAEHHISNDPENLVTLHTEAESFSRVDPILESSRLTEEFSRPEQQQQQQQQTDS